MRRLPAKDEMFLENGNLGKKALVDLYCKVASLLKLFNNERLSAQEFCGFPLYACERVCGIDFSNIDQSENAEKSLFLDCLRSVVKDWKRLDKKTVVHMADFDNQFFPQFINAHVEWDRAKANYGQNVLKNGRNWLDVDWHFSDSTIASACGLTRQAVAYQRNKLMQRSMNMNNEFAKFETMGKHIRFLRNEMIADMIGSDLVTVDALSRIPFADAYEALKVLPNAPFDKQQAAAKEISEHFTCESKKFESGDFSTIEEFQVKKGLTASEICRLLLAAFPDAVQKMEEAIEKEANLPEGAIAAVRELKPDWEAKFKSIPNIRETKSDIDPLIGLEDAKGVDLKEAARLLWVAYADEIENKPNANMQM